MSDDSDAYTDELKRLRKEEGRHLFHDCWCGHGKIPVARIDSADGVHLWVTVPCTCEGEQRERFHVHKATICLGCDPGIVELEEHEKL